MKNKIYFYASVLICLLLIIVSTILVVRRNRDNLCTPYADIATAVKTKDVKSCNCLRSDSLKRQCQSDINDAATYTNAINRGDLTACDQISNEGMKEACISIAQSKIDFINKK